MKAGDISEIRIEDVAFGGDGIGRLDDMAVFVPYTVDGDVVRVETTEVRKRYARGVLKEILMPSPYRERPCCADYTFCGGCRYQHITYEHQLVLKEKQVMDTFQRIGKFSDPPLLPVLASPHCCHYRIKADFHVSFRRGRRPVMGFMSGASNRVVEIKRCEIVDERINRLYGELRGALKSGKCPCTGDRITLWAIGGHEKDLDPAAAPFISRMVKDKLMTVPHDGFFQANQYLIEEMVDRVVAAAGLAGGEIVIDGFCGSGLFSLFLAPLAGTLHGIEGNGRAIRAAGENLERHGCRNVSLFQGDVGEVLEKIFSGTPNTVDVLVIDPPRTGCGEKLLEQIIRLQPRRIVYVSCNPATQARDIRLLCDGGFRLESLQPLDMFPQTAHIEVIALLFSQTSP
ncbi:MAG TPA: class I SAM-dependent RNA methyltransferase [Syntrophales bacterium]|nr:class I SAM-dependent RNA methyltransferase [Syntrophales bacterium]HQA83369.1 class I SAM-dependent RNA methyltransferase [Syntrophales bacterium]